MSELLILMGLFDVLAIGGLISDYIFPHIEPINHFIDSLPMMRDDCDENNIELIRKERAA